MLIDGQPIVDLYRRAPWRKADVAPPPGGRGFGRHANVNELKILPDDVIDAISDERRGRVLTSVGPR